MMRHVIGKTCGRLSSAQASTMSFHIGQQVVCVGNRFSSNPYWWSKIREFPRLGTIYTISEIREGFGVQQGLIGFCFYEIANPLAYFHRGEERVLLEPAFNSKHFRPVKPTTIDVFIKLLKPQKFERIM